MGLFNKFKGLFKKAEKSVEEKEELKSYDEGLKKTRNYFTDKISILNGKYKKVTDEYFEELEEILIMADIGVNTVIDFIDKLKRRVKKENITDSEELKDIIVDEMFIIYINNEIVVNKINYSTDGPTVILFVAGAVEQIKEWGVRTDCEVVSKDNSDPASVVYDGVKKAIDDNIDVVLVDTAGRLQNKTNLMEELAKMNRVIKKLLPEGPQETLLVLDATTGQNGISQAKSFKEITDVTGIVLTKLDGTAKGGIVLAIKDTVDIPVKFVGLGETKEDLKVFDIEKYIYGLFKDM